MDSDAPKKFRDVQRNGRAAVVIDDLAGTDPWRSRWIEVGVAPRRWKSLAH